MVEYNEVNIKLSKNQTRVTLRMNIKMFEKNNLSCDLLLTTR